MSTQIDTPSSTTPTDQPAGRPPRRNAKAALAAAVAAVLLLGGAGSLAYWNDSKDITGTDISSGVLALGVPSCGSGWLYGATGNVPLVSQLVIPGTVLRKLCTISITATGTDVKANLGIGSVTFTGGSGLATQLVPSAVYNVGGVTKTQITATDNGSTLNASITVTLPFGAGVTNASQGLTTALNNVAVTATQVES